MNKHIEIVFIYHNPLIFELKNRPDPDYWNPLIELHIKIDSAEFQVITCIIQADRKGKWSKNHSYTQIQTNSMIIKTIKFNSYQDHTLQNVIHALISILRSSSGTGTLLTHI